MAILGKLLLLLQCSAYLVEGRSVPRDAAGLSGGTPAAGHTPSLKFRENLFPAGTVKRQIQTSVDLDDGNTATVDTGSNSNYGQTSGWGLAEWNNVFVMAQAALGEEMAPDGNPTSITGVAEFTFTDDAGNDHFIDVQAYPTYQTDVSTEGAWENAYDTCTALEILTHNDWTGFEGGCNTISCTVFFGVVRAYLLNIYVWT